MAVVTLQIGNYANTVGAHLWNLRYGCVEGYANQDDIQSSSVCLFREEPSKKKDSTFSPRLVAIDVKDHMVASQPPSDVVRKEEEYLNWTGKCTTFVQDSAFVSDDYVSWFDLLHRAPPESSLLPVHHPSSPRCLQLYPWGRAAAGDRKWAESLEDRLHPLLEECDHLQGFQILADGHNGFAGVASGVAELLCEEFGSSRLLVFPCFPSLWPSEMKLTMSVLNSVLLTNQIISSCGLVVPLSMSKSLWPRPSSHAHSPYLSYESNHPRHTAPVLAVAMDTAVLGYQNCLQQTVAGLSRGNRKLAMLSGSLPLPLMRGSSLVQSLKQAPSGHVSFTPYLKGGELWDHWGVVRGIPKDYIIDADAPTRTAVDVYSSYAAPGLSELSQVQVVEQPLLLPPSFPSLFPPSPSPMDLLHLHHARPGPGSKVPMATSLSSGVDSHLLLSDLLKFTLPPNTGTMQSFQVTREELSEAQQNITALQSSYCEEYSQELENDE